MPENAALPVSSPARVRSGILLMFGCAFTFASMDALVKHLTGHVPLLQLVWSRYFFHCVVMLLIFGPLMRARLWRANNMRWQIGRGMMLMTSTCLGFASLMFLPLAEFTAIAFVTPLIVTVLARPMLGEQVTAARWIAVIAGFAGVLIIVRPGGNLFGWAVLLPLAMSFVYAVFQILTRRHAGADDPITTLFFSGLVGAVLTSFAVPLVWKTPGVAEWPLLVMVGVMGAGGHLLLVLAFRRAPASTLAPISYTQLLFATAVGYAVSRHIPDRWALVGMGVIALAGLYAAVLQAMEGRRRSGDEAEVPISD